MTARLARVLDQSTFGLFLSGAAFGQADNWCGRLQSMHRWAYLHSLKRHFEPPQALNNRHISTEPSILLRDDLSRDSASEEYFGGFVASKQSSLL